MFVLAVRVFATAWGGWLVVRGRGPLRAAAIAGIALLVLDMVILTGASFLIRGEVRAFVNAVIATVITAPLAAALAALGGYAAQQTARRTAA